MAKTTAKKENQTDTNGKTVKDYKKKLSSIFVTVTPDKIDQYLNGDTFHVTRKYDGQLAVLFFDGKAVMAYNTGGKQLPGLPCTDEAAALLAKAKVKEAVIAAELYAEESAGRTRVYHSVSALADPKKHASLRLAPFDILSLDGVEWDVYATGGSYGDTHKKLAGLFSGGKTCESVRYAACNSREAVKKLFDEWVSGESAEGLVVYGKTRSAAKIKPFLTVDAAVIGFSESDTPESLRCLLYALITEDGEYMVIGRTGSGLSDDDKKRLWKDLMKRTAKSDYIEVDSNHAAFRFVPPGMVVELAAADVLVETTKGPIKSPLLTWDGKEWKHAGAAPGYSLTAAQIVRFRDDKKPDAAGVGTAQLRNYAVNLDADAAKSAAKSTPAKILKREVYQKSGGKTMLKKFIAWKTNKDESQYPAYCFSYTDFSAGRADPLSIDVRVSSSEKQIMAIYDSFVAENVKKGWEKR